MSPVTARRLARSLWAAELAMVAAGAAMTGVIEPRQLPVVVVMALAILGYGTVGALIGSRYPANPIGWLFAAVALALGITVFGQAYSVVGVTEAQQNLSGTAAGTLPGALAVGWAALLVPAFVLPFALPTFLLVFPDGRLRSPRWRIGIAAAAAAGILFSLGVGTQVLGPGQRPAFPALDEVAEALQLYAVGGLLTAAVALSGVASVLLRYRRAAGEERRQQQWLAGTLVLMAGSAAIGSPLGWAGFFLAILGVGLGVLVGIPLSTAIAVLTYGLYDVGIVVKKSVVYGLLIVSITVFFFALVVGLPLALGVGRSDSGPIGALVSVGGAVLVGLALGPLRPRVQRFVNRLVYGRRATPYEVMSAFSDRVGESYATEDVLYRMAEIVRSSTGASTVRVWLHLGGELREGAIAPPDAPRADPIPLEGGDLPAMTGRTFAVRHRGELLGALEVDMPANEPLSKTGEQLVVDLAGQAGLVLRNVRLTEELRESRRRIVTAQDQRARKLERDIHDGAQQQLVALAVKLRLAEQLSERDPGKVASLLAEIRGDATDALENVRDLARGIYPPLLADAGLVAAIQAHMRRSVVPCEISPDGIGRYRQEVESAVYFCILEALQNVTKYAEASLVQVRLSDRDGRLGFEVVDDGRGFDPGDTTPGSGLQGMADRLEALGGSLEVRSAAGAGTTVTGSVPTG